MFILSIFYMKVARYKNFTIFLYYLEFKVTLKLGSSPYTYTHVCQVRMK